jgi:FkbM family methyltransferase
MKYLEKIAIIFFDIIDKYFHQKKIIKYLNNNFRNLDIFFDIGSHKGTYTDLIMNNFKVKKVIMVEPQKNIYKYIKKKYKKKKYIIIYNNALSDKQKTQTLYINKHDLTSSLTKIDMKNKYLNLKAKLFGGTINEMILKKNLIKSYKLINIINKDKIKKIDLLKIDTEGHELQVLKGAGIYMKKNVKSILIEFHNSDIFQNYDAKKIHKYLKKNNFVLKKIFKFPFTTWEDRIYQNKYYN